MTSKECFLKVLHLLNYEQVDECDKNDYLRIIREDLEDYSIIREIEDNVRAGKKVILNDNKYYACEFILAEEGTIRHLTISNRKYKKILRFEDYKKHWRFEE